MRTATMLVVAALAASALAENPPAKDDAARRAAVAKLGRLVWSDVGKPPAFCDLDGGNVVESDAPACSSVKWLADGKRVVACGGERLFVIDAATGKSTRLVPDDASDAKLQSPRVSDDRSEVVVWRDKVHYAVFDLTTAKTIDLWPAADEDWYGTAPPCWFAPDGTILAVMRGETSETLVRFDATGKRLADVAVAPPDGKIRQVATLRDLVAYTIERRDHVEVRDAAGNWPFSSDRHEKPTLLRWLDDGAALRLDTVGYGYDLAAPVSRRLALAPGKPAVVTRLATDVSAAVVAADGSWRVEQREGSLVRVDPPDMELVLGPGSSPRRLAGDFVVFWRVTVPNRPDPRPAFEHSHTIQGTDDLWAMEPTRSAVFRMTDRGFTARCWDLYVTPPPASRTR